jgi:gluconate kinase
MSKDDDRLDWLREIRKQIAKECNNDPKVMGKYFRSIQKQYEDRVLKNFSTVNPEEILSEKKSA